MGRSPESNFAARLFSRLGNGCDLIDAATGEVIAAANVPNRIVSFAAGFSSAGLEPGDRVLISCNVSHASTLAYLGAMYAGLTVVPVNERGLSMSGEAIFKITGARAVWTNPGTQCKWATRFLHIEGSFDTREARSVKPASRHEDDLAALMPTSGSTGRPRLVKVSHGNLTTNTEAIIRSQHLEPDERAMLILPLSYCFGASVVHTHLYQGGGVVYDSRFMFPDKVLHAIGRYRCTTFAGVPTAYNILLRRSNIRSIPLTSLRRFLQAGGALAPKQIWQMREIVRQAEFFVMYGQTEATSRISCLPPNRLSQKLGSVGLPLDNILVRIVDESGRDLPSGQIGEIWVRGKSICSGYFDEPEETARKFRNGWLATGDMASRDQDGFLWIAGRKSEFIKMRGVRVSLAEIEIRVAASSGVCECAAIAVEHAEAGEAVALYVVAEQGAHDVIASIRRNMPPEWICDSVSLVAELPRNFHGKLVRSRLPGIVRSRDSPLRVRPSARVRRSGASVHSGK
jgi:acyl-CoA synthetase (AMP-forming)/AMP-acid ligase II